MCDIIEIVTRPSERPVFYPATSTAFAFDIKGRGNVTIGLSRHARDTDVDIKISDRTDGDDNRSFLIEIEFNGGIRMREDIPEILDDDYYRSFWLSWYSGEIRFGRKGEIKPMFIHGLCELELVKYITFSTNNEQNEVRWRFQLPPVIERPRTIRTISGGKPTWKRGVPSRLPNNVIIGGFENEPLYIIRSFHDGELCVGKFVPSERSAVVSIHGQSHKKQAFDVLCGFNYQWVPTKNNRIPANAVEGGYIEDSHEIFYVGRAHHDGHLIPGKVLYRHNCIYFAYKEKEIANSDYEVLTVPKEEIYYINKSSNKGCFTFCSSNSDQRDGDEEESDLENFARLRSHARLRQARRERRMLDGGPDLFLNELFDENRHVSREQVESDEDHKVQNKTERFQAKSIKYILLEIINKIICFLFQRNMLTK